MNKQPLGMPQNCYRRIIWNFTQSARRDGRQAGKARLLEVRKPGYPFPPSVVCRVEKERAAEERSLSVYGWEANA